MLDYQNFFHKMDMILNTYDLENELELITECHSNTPEEVKNNDDVETASKEFRSLRNETQRIFEKYMTHKSVNGFILQQKSFVCCLFLGP